MTLLLVVLSRPRPRRATGLLIRRHSIVFRIFSLNLGDPFHGGEDPARGLHRDALRRRPIIVPARGASPFTFFRIPEPWPGELTASGDHRATPAQILGSAGGGTEWLPVLDSCRKAALFPAHTRRRYRSGVGRPNSPCIDPRHKAAADSRPSARPVALGRGATA